MADWHFAKAQDWPELVGAHERFVEDYDAQEHWAHRERKDGRRSPAEVLGFVSGVRHREEELGRAFFSSRFVRVLDALGYARFRHWRVYGEEALAGREAALWLAAESLTVDRRPAEALRDLRRAAAAQAVLARRLGRGRLAQAPKP